MGPIGAAAGRSPMAGAPRSGCEAMRHGNEVGQDEDGNARHVEYPRPFQQDRRMLCYARLYRTLHDLVLERDQGRRGLVRLLVRTLEQFS